MEITGQTGKKLESTPALRRIQDLSKFCKINQHKENASLANKLMKHAKVGHQ